MSLALRTFVAMNFDVVVMAVRRRVRSPVAAAPRRYWSFRTCLRSTCRYFQLSRRCYLGANLVTVTISVVIARSSAISRKSWRLEEGKGWWMLLEQEILMLIYPKAQ